MPASSLIQSQDRLSAYKPSVPLLSGWTDAYSNRAESSEKTESAIPAPKRKIPTQRYEEDLMRSPTSADEVRQSDNRPNRTNIVAFNRQSQLASEVLREEILKKWEGRIIRITYKKVTANLIEFENDHSRESSSISIPKAEFSEDDIATIRVGSVFIWLIGYRYKNNRTKERFSRIILRRLPVWTKREIDRADRRAREVAAALEWD